jgi:flavin-dependent dehydrogenase
MNQSINNIVIVGGGTAGWLTASILAAHFDTNSTFSITLIESPDVKTIGVGEGTWPTMAATLRRIGISEAQFISECDASFKQGSRFIDWNNGESYYHPFSLPMGYKDINLVEHWLETNKAQSFDEFSTIQTGVCNLHLAPKQINTPEYANVVNYGYHLNAGKFADLLKKHSTNNLNVKHISSEVTSIHSDKNSNIQYVTLSDGTKISADLFIDCTGFKRLLISKHLKVPFKSVKDILFNDRAIAFQVPYNDENAPINSTTHATAHQSGWIWDISLPTRKGIGVVYSSKYANEEEALNTAEHYINTHLPHIDFKNLSPNKIEFDPGHIESYWKGNCVAIGLSAGFIDPLEATAMILIEFSANFLRDHLPASKNELNLVANKFNQRMDLHWKNILDFIKLHYVLSNRTDSEYWLNHRQQNTIPDSLKHSLMMWKNRAPWHADMDIAESMFPPASYQFILYGMRFNSKNTLGNKRLANQERLYLKNLLINKRAELDKLCQHLPTNRVLLSEIKHNWLNRV